MPNAKDVQGLTAPKILALGMVGAGKTTQFLTLPGKKFMYCFDPNAVLSLMGYDVEYEPFYPANLSLKLTSLSEKGKQQAAAMGQRPKAKSGHEVYAAWEKDFEDKVAHGFFDEYDAIGFDSFTTLQDLVMDGVLAVNGRGGQWPQQDDYGPQMLTLSNIFRTLTGLNKIIYCPGHVEPKQDEVTKRIHQWPLMTGRLRTKLPLLFSEVLVLESEVDQRGNSSYVVQTKRDREYQVVRSSMRGAPYKENVTLDFNKPLVGQGLGGLLMKYGIIKRS